MLNADSGMKGAPLADLPCHAVYIRMGLSLQDISFAWRTRIYSIESTQGMSRRGGSMVCNADVGQHVQNEVYCIALTLSDAKLESC